MTLISKSRTPDFVFKSLWILFFLIFNCDNSVSLHPTAWFFFFRLFVLPIYRCEWNKIPSYCVVFIDLNIFFSATVTLQVLLGITLYCNDHAHIIFCIYKWLWLELINDYVTHRLSGLKVNPHESNTNQGSYHDAWGSLQHQTYSFFSSYL